MKTAITLIAFVALAVSCANDDPALSPKQKSATGSQSLLSGKWWISSMAKQGVSKPIFDLTFSVDAQGQANSPVLSLNGQSVQATASTDGSNFTVQASNFMIKMNNCQPSKDVMIADVDYDLSGVHGSVENMGIVRIE